MLVFLLSGAEAQGGGGQVTGRARLTRASLDAAGGSMSGPRNLRAGSASLGSGAQTGILTGHLRLTSGFVQRKTATRAPAAGLEGDFNEDGRVDFDDFFLFAAAFGSREARFDMTRDGRVDFDDFFLFAAAFGRKR